MRRIAVVGTALAALLSAPALASADPEVPQFSTPCTSSLSDAMTWPPDGTSPLVCLNGQWQSLTTPQPPNDRWLSYGPPMTLHGEGLRNPNVASGDWTAIPLDSNSTCRAEQRAVLGPGQVGPPQVSEGQSGQQLSLQFVPQLFSIQLSGYCLWTRASS
ncbi:MAG: hypothetical protein NVSMB60_32400 [Mycobacterium sp.]